MVTHSHRQRRKVITLSLVIAVILFISFPFLLILANGNLANYLHKELAYRYISNKVTESCKSDLEKAVMLNSFIFLSEEQRTSFTDVVDNSVYLDLVRHTAWCDQQANGLVHLLEKQNIKARTVMFPCHSVAEVWIDNIPRFFDPMFNCYFVYENDRTRVATLEEVLNDNDNLIMSNGGRFPAYGGKAITTCGNCRNWSILIDAKPPYKKMLSETMDFYYSIGGDFFCDVFQDFLFSVMEKFRGGKIVDFLGPIVTSERMLSEYKSETYFDLYKARSYHLFNNFSKANSIYDDLLDSKDFKDDALFFKAQVALQTKKFSELKKYTSIICDERREATTTGTDGNEIEYLFFLKAYLKKFYLIENWQLENIFNFTDPEINEVKGIYEEYFNKPK